MEIFFDLELDQPAWRGLQASRWNEAWVGPRGLVEVLERQLGLTRTATTMARRCAQVAGRVPDPWAAAAAQDPFGVARSLLGDYDLLRLWGVAAVSPRLRGLFEFGRGAPPGLADRLEAVLQAPPPPVSSLTVLQPDAPAPTLVRRLLDHLAGHGAAMQPCPQPLSASSPAGSPGGPGGGGHGARQPNPAGLRWWVRQDPWRAAEELAAELAGWPCAETLIVGGDAVLDAALARHGLPTLGAPAGPPAALQLVASALELMLDPIDPACAVDFLACEPNPLALPLRRRLLGALGERAAVGSSDWRAALPDAGAAAEVGGWFAPTTGRADLLRVEGLRRRLARVVAFIDGVHSSAGVDGGGQGGLATALEAGRELVECLDAWGGERMPVSAARRLQAMVLADCRGVAAQPATVGWAQAAPSAVVAPAPRLVWWNAVEGSTPVPALPHLLPPESAHPAVAALALPSPAAVSRAAARRAERPLAMAAQQLLVVQPRQDAEGREVGPHPALAAVAGRARDAGDYGPPVTPRRPRPWLRAAVRPALLRRHAEDGARAEESASSLRVLLGCSLKWALDYPGRLRAVALPNLRLDRRRLGNVAHGVLERALADPAAPAIDQLETIFDEQVGEHAAACNLPQFAVLRADWRRRVVGGLHRLLAMAQAEAWQLGPPEAEVHGQLGAVPLAGRLDVTLVHPPAVIDLKTGAADRLRGELLGDTALQLAAYSHLLAGQRGSGAALVPAGYFLLGQQALITAGAIRGGEALAVGLQGTRDALAAAVAAADGRLAAGQVEAAGNRTEADREAGADRVDHGVLHVAAPCQGCGYRFACGRAEAR